jgi:hypothetical protein
VKLSMRIFTLAIISCLFIWSCSKDHLSSDPNAVNSLTFSTGIDTVKFDTVFTAQGSTTQIVKIFNNNSQKISFSSIDLGGGDASSYSLNINGRAANSLTDVTLEAGDSLYVFVKVNISPNATTSPFIVSDSINFRLNGNVEKLYLQAYGQNAHYISTANITKDTTWNADLPIVVMNDILLPTSTKLNIAKGVKVYFHGNTHLLINGTLNALGDSLSRIQMTTDRLDDPYNTVAGSWGGLTFGAASSSNILQYISIKNAQIAIADTSNTSVNSNYKLTLNSCEIYNCSNAGIAAVNSNIYLYNSLIYNNNYNISIAGGNYNLLYNTIAAYSNNLLGHNNPCITVGNSSTPINLAVKNSIIYGENATISNELSFDTQLSSSNAQVSLTNSLLKISTTPSYVQTSNLILNVDPLFTTVNNDRAIYDFHLQNNSPALQKALYDNSVLIDYQGNLRSITAPTVGAFE